MVAAMPGPKDNKQEHRQMKRKAAEGLAAVDRIAPAANEEFTGTVNGLDKVAAPQSGWDPYEVWRTRVKVSSGVIQERERDPLH